MRYLFRVVLAGIGALLIQHFVLYRLLMIPGLESLQSIPLYWWLCYLAPITIVLLLAGLKSASFKCLTAAAGLLAVSANLVSFFWAKFGEPGFSRGYQIDMLGSFVKDYVFHFLLFLLVMSFGRMVMLLLDTTLGWMYRRIK